MSTQTHQFDLSEYQHLLPDPLTCLAPDKPVDDVVLSDVLKPMLDQLAGVAECLADGVQSPALCVPHHVQHATSLLASYATSASKLLEAWEQNDNSCRCNRRQ